ncbi:uncharacterized protein LOC127530004 [Erpetoichthys calabaricus]|uniref:uncharacterized protein LOC127530004 n=1 Tax=Erpetoichthys calabaricus TaxID=27687 RepID=UPI0022344066|nr:uncharacterized protein LOC127530004 [Erpetoichthys calabaricus]
MTQMRKEMKTPSAPAVAAGPLDPLDEEPAPARHLSLAQAPRAADLAVEGIPNRRRHRGNSGFGTKRRCFRCDQTGHLARECHLSPAQSMEVDLPQNATVESRSVRRTAVKRSMNRHIPQEAGIYAQLVNTDDNKSFASFYGGSFQGNRKADYLRLPPLKTCQEPLSNSPTTATVNKDTRYKDDKKKPDDGQIKNKSEGQLHGEQRHKKGNFQSNLTPELKIESCFSKGDGLYVPEQMFQSLHRNKHWNHGVFRQTTDIKRNPSFKAMFPDIVGVPIVQPLLKETNFESTLPNNNRSISKLPFRSKILETDVAVQLAEALKVRKICDKFQSGFHTMNFTETAVIKVSRNLYNGC